MELKPCPFCGREPVHPGRRNYDADPDRLGLGPCVTDGEYHAVELNKTCCLTSGCPMCGIRVKQEAWQQRARLTTVYVRPVEDALATRVAELEAERDRLREALEEQIGRCSMCSGSGRVYDEVNDIFTDQPCPDCQTARALLARLEG